jgi:glyoxylase-like metal-dependent hydrolase (beta-lactamase superfamily II)
VDRLRKPIDRVIVTHSHPDHWAGLEFFKDAPIYALAETRYELENYGDDILNFKRLTQGDQLAAAKVVPTQTLKEGEEVIDGVKYVFTKVCDAEAPTMLMIELPEHQTLIAQDLVYNKVYPAVGEKNQKGDYLFAGWLKALKSLQKKGYSLVLPGHGAPTDGRVFTEMAEYIRTAQQLFESGMDEAALKKALQEKYPGYQVPEMLDISNVFLYHRNW